MHVSGLTSRWPVDDDEWFWEEPRKRNDGKTEVEVLNEVGPSNYCHFHCVWNNHTGLWVCEGAEHKYVEALHLGEEVDEEHGTYDIDEDFGALIRAAYGIPKGRISALDALHTAPDRLKQLSQRS